MALLGFYGQRQKMTIRQDYKDFAKLYLPILNTISNDCDITIDFCACDECQLINCDDTPFATNSVISINGVKIVAYNTEIISECNLSEFEQYACLLHEVGHLLNAGQATDGDIECSCDNVAVKANMTIYLISALYKMQDKLGVNLQDRIDVLHSHLHLFRPKWTCGRYNKEKHVAIMYNLIAGFSYFFNDFSAMVVGEILKVGRNGNFDIEEIAKATGIHKESICHFFVTLLQCGLLTDSIPTEEGIKKYRQAVIETRKSNQSWVDKTTEEKLPMEVTNAEQSYFATVDDGKTICSCMFELTYRCSEMCIHCYNPGATRNSTETSHRADYGELDLESYKHIIDDMYEHGLVKVCLSGGDPFSKEIVWELLDYLYEKGIAVDVFTNGLRLAGSVNRFANYFPRLVGVSIYSGKAEDHDAITRIPGSWKRSMQIVEELYHLAVPMNIKCCIMQPNLHSYYMVADLAKEFGAIPQFEVNISESNDGDVCAKRLRLTEKQLQIVLRDNNLALYVGKEAPNYGGQKRDLSTFSCGAGSTGFCMSPNGDLRACSAFTQVYGNLSEASVDDVLSNSPALKERKKAIVSDYTECGRHDYCDYCNLCAGLNYTEHGDFRVPAETNCYMAKCRYNLAHKLMEHDEDMTRDEFIEVLQQLPIEEITLRREYRVNG